MRQAMTLADALPAQNFAAYRETYLAKQLLALETVSRKLNGETFTLQEEARRCFDIEPTWTPEAQFEKAFALYEDALPGSGSIPERLQAWRKHYQLPAEKSHLIVGFMRRAMDEARRRVQDILQLPEGEEVELDTVSDKVFGGENWYLGNYRSRVELNTDLPTNLLWLMDLVCHEGYPGHHTEFMLKEQHLYRENGYLEQAISPIICPQSLISEGIATSAFAMVFTYEEADQWLAEHIYPEAGIVPFTGPVDRKKLREASELITGVECNAAFMLNEGLSDNEVIQYIKKYQMLNDEEAQKGLEFLQDPYREAYIFTYSYGHNLMRPWLAGDDRLDVFNRFLTEPIYPSELVRV
ncbi:MAG TPA: hypothetical protein VKR42_02490 [Ktedonobacteraceae bacterium]|nr:hypothetical protein [Ktedonobacteraceae bacterium]